MATYKSSYTGPQIDQAVSHAVNMDVNPTAGHTDRVVSSGGVKSALDTFVRPNLLDNPNFVGGGSQQGGGQFPVNQRGQTTYNGQVYGVDRWHTSKDSAVVTVASGYLGFKSGVYGNLEQEMENPSQYAGKTLTFSVLFDGTSHNDAIFGAQFTSGYNQSVAKDTFNSWTFTVPSDAGLRYIFIQSLNASYTYHIVAMKLELGPDQTLAHQENGVWVLNEIPNYQQELEKCQWYQRHLAAWEDVFYGAKASGGIRIEFPFQFRVAPDALSGQTVDIVGTNGTEESYTISRMNFYKDKSGLTHAYIADSDIPNTQLPNGIVIIYFTSDAVLSANL